MNKKINILVPLAGKAQRFVDNGINIPKPLILAGDHQIIDWSLDSIDYSNCNLIFVIRNDHACNYSLDEILYQKYGKDIKIVKTYKDTRGSVESCLYAKNLIDNPDPLLIFCIDVHSQPKFNPYSVDENLDGLTLTFQSNSPNYSYVEINENELVTNVMEKTVISNHANVGAYYFKHGYDFVESAEEMIKRNLLIKNEFYIAPVYNLMIEKGKKIGIRDVDKIYVMGTPRELKFFESTCLNKFGNGKIALWSDHSGFEMKERFKQELDFYEIPYIDYGCYVNKNCDQIDYTKIACKAIQDKICNYGIGFCRTGQAINIAANKFKGIKCALIYNEYSAEYAIRHNGVNCFSIASKFIKEEEIQKIIYTFMTKNFDGGRHQVRVQKIEDIENEHQ